MAAPMRAARAEYREAACNHVGEALAADCGGAADLLGSPATIELR